MAVHGLSRGHWLLMLLAASGVALVCLLAVLQRGSPARADEQAGHGHQVTLERSSASTFQQELIEAAKRGGVGTQIVGGTAVPNGKYPFMAVLDIGRTDGSHALCGGSLIDSNSVLTAAHCLEEARSVELAVGRTVLSQNQGKVRFATRAFIHPSYNGALNNRYDAAVLKLNRAVRGIRPIKLATAAQNGFETPGRKLTVAGWGTTSEGGDSTNRMREVSVPVVSDATAQQAYASTGSPDLRYFPSLMVAAGVKGKDSCQGDSGEPLFKPGATRTEVGIVSYGNGCARAGFPGVYTEVNYAGIRTFIVNSAGR